jgi:hypothetical protein
MDKQQPYPAQDAGWAGTKARWTAPQVDRLVAGGAEANAGADVEGLDGLS